MNKLEMAAELATRASLTQVKAIEVLSQIFDADEGILAGALAQGDKVTLAGFGTFFVRERSARQGVNPLTKERIQIPAKKSAGFRVGKNLKARLVA